MPIIDTTDQDLQKIVTESKLPVLLLFWADWWEPCEEFTPVFIELAQHYQGKVNFARINVTQFSEYFESFQLRDVPTLIYFRDGKAVAKGGQVEEEGLKVHGPWELNIACVSAFIERRLARARLIEEIYGTSSVL